MKEDPQGTQMEPPTTASGQRPVFGLKQNIGKHVSGKRIVPNLVTGSQQNMEREGRMAVARVATYSHQLIRQSRLEPRDL